NVTGVQTCALPICEVLNIRRVILRCPEPVRPDSDTAELAPDAADPDSKAESKCGGFRSELLHAVYSELHAFGDARTLAQPDAGCALYRNARPRTHGLLRSECAGRLLQPPLV